MFYLLKKRVVVLVTQEEFIQDCLLRNSLGVQVELTKLGGAFVSTVFIGFDVSLSGNPTPTLFETMVYGGRWNQYKWHYKTLEYAEENHVYVVKLVRAEQDEIERIYRSVPSSC